jgi:hypothetical protein
MAEGKPSARLDRVTKAGAGGGGGGWDKGAGVFDPACSHVMTEGGGTDAEEMVVVRWRDSECLTVGVGFGLWAAMAG